MPPKKGTLATKAASSSQVAASSQFDLPVLPEKARLTSHGQFRAESSRQETIASNVS
jgi:hypothetical protein